MKLPGEFSRENSSLTFSRNSQNCIYRTLDKKSDCTTFLPKSLSSIINNYSPKAKLILLNNPRDEVFGKCILTYIFVCLTFK